MKTPAEIRVPVLIVGGSLVGLSASVLLGRLGIPHLVIEKRRKISDHSRARGYTVRTMEIYRAAGLEEAIDKVAADRARHLGVLRTDRLDRQTDHFEYIDRDPDGLGARMSPVFWAHCPQAQLEPLLLSHARQYGADVRFGTQMINLEQDQDKVAVTAKVNATGEQLTIHADYVLAADGAHSTARECLGIGVSGRGVLMHYLSVLFRADLEPVVAKRRFAVCHLEHPQAPGLLLPIDDNDTWIFQIPYHPTRGQTPRQFTIPRITDYLRTAIGDPDLDMQILSTAPWAAAETIAERFHAGRVFLVGDSAHQMPPAGAFGANTGIQDAHNLAWKIAAVHHGYAGPGLLDTYEAERRPVALATAERACERSTELSSSLTGAVAPSQRPPLASPSTLLVAYMAYRYNSQAVLGPQHDDILPPTADLSGEPGTRAPHLWLDDQGRRISTLDLFEQHFVLLSCPSTPWHSAACQIAERDQWPLRSYRIGTGPNADLTTDQDTDWISQYGITAQGAVLVRPDGFVAWRTNTPPPPGTETTVLTGILSDLLCNPSGGGRGRTAAERDRAGRRADPVGDTARV
ncbi:FAD-dependent monooxygenase [Streptomyces cellulosae]|uniref:FAD-dependent monooxygenase n=1 Tax=Streptomyces cellulosae TaxID=1968 RepID=UPI0007C6388A|nr:FAD-dependent monooxygenase [Streptomyces cellulosae]